MTEQRPTNPDLPQVIATYRLEQVLGRGGMGTVYQATDLRSGVPVAFKLLHPEIAADESFRERFTREAHVASLLRSPYTVPLLDSASTTAATSSSCGWSRGERWTRPCAINRCP